jgi:thiol-disulfide isomerase/thioredoxin
MRHFRVSFLLTTLLLVGRSPAEGPKADPAAAAAFTALSTEYDQLYNQTRSSYKAVKNDERIDEEARKYRAKVHKIEAEYALRFLAIAEKYPGDAVAIDALVRAARLGAGDSAGSEKALVLLERDHLKDGKLSEVLTDVGYSTWPDSDKFLRSVLEKNASRDARGLAGYWLAYRLKVKANDDLNGIEADKATREAEALLQMVIAKYADVPAGPLGPLGKRASTALVELQRLAPGHVAPEIEGMDGDDKPFKLSDYRGKVVVLDFWGHWCPDCRAIYPRQRSLVRRLEGKPFVLIGVNSDENKDDLKKVLEKRGVTWRFWWDGGSRSGPIASAWNIQGWPTLYILDHKGVIRHKGHEELADKLDQIVDELVKEAEAAGSTR